jgi:hypothetical protein
VGKICLIFHIILQAAYNVGACALNRILPSRFLMVMTYFMADTKATTASVHGVGIDFKIDMDSAFPQRCESCF